MGQWKTDGRNWTMVMGEWAIVMGEKSRLF